MNIETARIDTQYLSTAARARLNRGNGGTHITLIELASFCTPVEIVASLTFFDVGQRGHGVPEALARYCVATAATGEDTNGLSEMLEQRAYISLIAAASNRGDAAFVGRAKEKLVQLMLDVEAPPQSAAYPYAWDDTTPVEDRRRRLAAEKVADVDTFFVWLHALRGVSSKNTGRTGAHVTTQAEKIQLSDWARSVYIRDGQTVQKKNVTAEPSMWWVIREAVRKAHLYPPRTQALIELDGGHSVFMAACMHRPVAAPDPYAVAYTPSSDYGRQDRQVVVSSLSKLLHKLYPFTTDEEARHLEALHRSEIDPAFLVARTAAEIRRAYTTMAGDTGCMSKLPSHFHLHESLHPSAVYEAPGMGVAYIQAGDRVMARSVIWDNPADPADKRYVRCYGVNTLVKKLEAQGYKCGSLAGARLKRIGVKTEDGAECEDAYVVPYLDGPAGRAADDTGSWVRLDPADPNYLRVISRAEGEKLNGSDGSDGSDDARVASSARGISGRLTLRPPAQLAACHVTGVPLSLENTAVILVDGVEHAVHCDVGQHVNMMTTVALGTRSAAVPLKELLESPNDRGLLSSFSHNTSDGEFAVLNTARNLEHWGLVALDATLYPPRGNEIAVAKTGDVVRTADSQVIRSAEAVFTVGLYADVCDTEQWVAHHRSHERHLKREGYVPTVAHGGRKLRVHKDHPRLVTLVSGLRAVRGVHDIKQIGDGRHMPIGDVAYTTVFGTSVGYPAKNRLKLLALEPLGFAKALKKALGVPSSAQLSSGVRGLSWAGADPTARPYTATIEQFRAAAATLELAHAEGRMLSITSQPLEARQFAYCVRLLLDPLPEEPSATTTETGEPA